MQGSGISDFAMLLLMFSILTSVRIASHRQISRNPPRLKSSEIIPAICLTAEARRRRGLNAEGHFSAPQRLSASAVKIVFFTASQDQVRLGGAARGQKTQKKEVLHSKPEGY